MKFEGKLEQVLQRPIFEYTWRDMTHYLSYRQKMRLNDFSKELDVIQDVLPIPEGASFLTWLHRAYEAGLLTKLEFKDYEEILGVTDPSDRHVAGSGHEIS